MREDRAVSTALGYVLTLGIVTLLIGGLFFAAGDFVEGQHDRVVRSEFEVIGNRLAADVAAVDRLALAAGPGGEARLRTDLPRTAAGQPYELVVSPVAGEDDVYAITATMVRPAVTVEVRVRSETTLASGTVGGGDVLVVYNGTALEVRDA